MPRLEALQLVKTFGALTAVDGVTLDFEPGKIHAILGENGAGKSTLMKLLFGLHRPSSGEIRLDGRPVTWRSSHDAIAHGIGMVQQHFTLVDSLSAIDNIMLGAEMHTRFGRLDRAGAIRRLEGLLPTPQLRVKWDAAIASLSVGERQRVEILKLLYREAEILFLDEPTAVLAPGEIEDFFEVLRRLKDSGKTILLITHKINEVLAVCDTFSVLRGGRLLAQGATAGANVDTIVETMIGRRLPEFEVERKPSESLRRLEADSVGSGGRLRSATLHVHAGEIVGIAGVEGSGQSDFVNAIMGVAPFSGDIRILGEPIQPLNTKAARRHGTGLIPEDRLEQALWPSESCLLNLMIGLEGGFIRNGVFQWKRARKAAAEWAKEFDVRAHSLDVPAETLSGGNQQKMVFAREVNGRHPQLLICHQPTRGVDLGAIDLIHRRLIHLRNDGLGILLLSSELDELLKLCDRLYVFFDGRVSAHFTRAEFDRAKIGAAMTGVAT